MGVFSALRFTVASIRVAGVAALHDAMRRMTRGRGMEPCA